MVVSPIPLSTSFHSWMIQRCTALWTFAGCGWFSVHAQLLEVQIRRIKEISTAESHKSSLKFMNSVNYLFIEVLQFLLIIFRRLFMRLFGCFPLACIVDFLTSSSWLWLKHALFSIQRFPPRCIVSFGTSPYCAKL